MVDDGLDFQFLLWEEDEGFDFPDLWWTDGLEKSALDGWVNDVLLICVVESSVDSRYWRRSILSANVVRVDASDRLFDWWLEFLSPMVSCWAAISSA